MGRRVVASGEGISRVDYFREYVNRTLTAYNTSSARAHLLAYGASLIGERHARQIIEEFEEF